MKNNLHSNKSIRNGKGKKFVSDPMSKALELDRVGDFLNAEIEYKNVLKKSPRNTSALTNLGVIYLRRGDPKNSIPLFEKSLHFDAQQPLAVNNLGNANLELNKPEEAISIFKKAILLDPNYFVAYNNLGKTLFMLHRFEEALQYLDQAIGINPNYARAHRNKGSVLQENRQYEQAISSYTKAFEIEPAYPFLLGKLVHLQQHICQWENLANFFPLLLKKVDQGYSCIYPFSMLATPSSPIQQKRCAIIYTKFNAPLAERLFSHKRKSHKKVRLGYVSSDFREHAVATLIAGLIEEHDRQKFEIIGISLFEATNDPMRARLKAAFDKFFDVHNLTEKEIAELIFHNEIDIVIDLNGFTRLHKTKIFSYRPAPIQVNFLGYPGTLGAEYFDYIIADSVLIPLEHRNFYTEKIAYLPKTYQANDFKRLILKKQFNRSDLGLPDQSFVFCSFNNSYKITPGIFDIWMRLLLKVEGSVLWLLEDNASAIFNLKNEAKKRGVTGDRLIFASRIKTAGHLARHKCADLFLDTIYYNGHTTTSDALWAGLPVVTHCGNTFASRVGASLLMAAGLPELIANSIEDYENLALRLATEPERLQNIRKKLASNKQTCALFNTKKYTKFLESAFSQMWNCFQGGKTFENIFVMDDVEKKQL